MKIAYTRGVDSVPNICTPQDNIYPYHSIYIYSQASLSWHTCCLLPFQQLAPLSLVRLVHLVNTSTLCEHKKHSLFRLSHTHTHTDCYCRVSSLL